MDWLVTLFYLPAYLLGWGISIILWYIIGSFCYKVIQDYRDLPIVKKDDHLDDVDNYY